MTPKTKKEAIHSNAPRYFTGKVCNKGHLSERYTNSGKCVECSSLVNKTRWKTISGSFVELEKQAKRTRAYRVQKPEKHMFYAARKRAKDKGLDFNITIGDIVIPTHCPILGVPLTVGNGRKDRCSPSLDRINNSLGYVKGNVQVISDRANSIKNDASLEEIRLIYEFMKG